MKRLESLDILRGFDLFLLLMFQPIIVQILRIAQCPNMFWLENLLDHAQWHGFTPWDMIMPLFMFMSGITIPFAFSKYKNGTPLGTRFAYKLAKRFLLLWIFGGIVQGNFLSLNLNEICLYSNTLQAIAVGYLFSVIFFIFLNKKWNIFIVFIIFSAYIAVFATVGQMNFTRGENIAEVIDKIILGHFRDGVIRSNDVWRFSEEYNYTWILSSLNFIVTMMLGVFSGEILRISTYTSYKKVAMLVGIGSMLLIVGYLIDPVIPIIKKIWSSSMTLVSGGYCFLLIALFYWMVDIKGWKKYLLWLKPYGMNSIVVYVLFNVVSFSSICNSVFYGLEPLLSIYYPVLITTFNAAIVYLISYMLYKKQIFIKV